MKRTIYANEISHRKKISLHSGGLEEEMWGNNRVTEKPKPKEKYMVRLKMSDLKKKRWSICSGRLHLGLICGLFIKQTLERILT